MRTAYLLAALFPLLISLPACAEGDYISFGGGLNLATFIVDNPNGTEPDQSDRFGGAFHLGYQTGTDGGNASLVSLGYESRGSVWTEPDGNGGNVDVNLKFNYLQLGFEYKLLLDPASGARFYLAPGIDAGFLVNSTAEAGADSKDFNDVTFFDLELAGAIGLQFPMNRNAWFLEGGYGYGLINTVDNSSSGGDASAHNSVIKLQVGFLLGI